MLPTLTNELRPLRPAMPLSDLQNLRVSLARVAQHLGVDGAGDHLGAAPVTRDSSYEQLCQMAILRERGWNRLAELCALRADMLRKIAAVVTA
jgi:hypothetical protein